MAHKLTQTAIAIGVFFLVNSAFAQQAVPVSGATGGKPESLEKVQVTGSRINLKQDQIAGVGPVTVIDSEAIQRSGPFRLKHCCRGYPHLPASRVTRPVPIGPAMAGVRRKSTCAASGSTGRWSC